MKEARDLDITVHTLEQMCKGLGSNILTVRKETKGSFIFVYTPTKDERYIHHSDTVRDALGFLSGIQMALLHPHSSVR